MGISKTIEIYTDGACSQNGTWKGGWGVVIIDENDTILKILDGSLVNTTNNAMELTAFKTALKYIVGENRKDLYYRVYSDSAYILNCFAQKWYVNWQKNGWRNAKKEPVANKELWEEILELYNNMLTVGIVFDFVKVKGHSGNKYNELADKLAVEASK